jgi:hypothetical protein
VILHFFRGKKEHTLNKEVFLFLLRRAPIIRAHQGLVRLVVHPHPLLIYPHLFQQFSTKKRSQKDAQVELSPNEKSAYVIFIRFARIADRKNLAR